MIRLLVAGLKITDQMDLKYYYGQSILFQTLAYPFLTVQRRLECRSKINMTFIANDEYRGFFDAVRKIYSQEGVTALYRGYFAYMLAVRT